MGGGKHVLSNTRTSVTLTFVSQPLFPSPAEEENGDHCDHGNDDGATQRQHDVHLLVELHLLLVHHIDRLDRAWTQRVKVYIT